MKRSLLSLTIFLPLLIASCVGYSYPKELSTADSLMDARPDRAMHIFKQLTIDSNAPESHRMYYELLHIKAKDKAAHLEKGDSIIEEVLDYYIDGGDETLLPQAYYYAGRYHAEQHDAPEALDYFQKAQELLTDNKQLKLKSVIASQMGYLFSRQDLNEEARKAFKEGYRYASLANDTIKMALGLNDIGTTYGFYNNADSALIYCKKALQLSEKGNRQQVVANLCSQVARYYNMAHRFEEALPYVRRSLLLSHGNTTRSIYSISSTTYKHLHKDDSAMMCYKELLKKDDIYGKRFAYQELADYYANHRQVDKALAEIKNYLLYEDSVNFVTNSDALARAKTLYDYQLREKENLILKNDNTKKNFTIIGMFALLLFIIVLFAIYYLYSHQKKEKYRLKLELYKEKIAKSATTVDKQAETSITGSKQYKQLKEDLIKKESLSQQDIMQLESSFKELFPQFLDNLSGLCRITEQERLICMLLKLGFGVNEMARLTCHTTSSVSKTRKRLAIKAFGNGAEISSIDNIIKEL